MENPKFKKLVDQLIEVKEDHTWFNFNLNQDIPGYHYEISLYDKGLYADIKIGDCTQYNFILNVILNVDVIEKIIMSAKAGNIRESIIKEVKAMLDITTKLSDGAKLLLEMN